jgi:hypothetical protein
VTTFLPPGMYLLRQAHGESAAVLFHRRFITPSLMEICRHTARCGGDLRPQKLSLIIGQCGGEKRNTVRLIHSPVRLHSFGKDGPDEIQSLPQGVEAAAFKFG